MLDVQAGGAGFVIVASIALAVFGFGGIQRGREVHAFRQRKGSRHPFFVIVVIAEIGFQNCFVGELEIQPQAGQLSAFMAAAGIAMAFVIQQVEPVFYAVAVIDRTTKVHGGQGAVTGAGSDGYAVQWRIGRAFGNQVKHSGWVCRPIQRTRKTA